MHQSCSDSKINAYSLQLLSSLAGSGKGFLVGEQDVNIQAPRCIQRLVQWITGKISSVRKKARYNVQAEYSFYGGLMRHRGRFRFARFKASAAVWWRS